MNLESTTSNAPTTLAAWPLAICQALSADQIEPQALLASVGLNKREFESDPDQRVNIDKMLALWQAVEQVTQDSAYGLKIANYVQPTHFRALGMLMLTCSDIEQALTKLGQYHALISNSVEIQLIDQIDRIGFHISSLPNINISPLAIDAFFATLKHFSKLVTGQQNLVCMVDFVRPEPLDSSLWLSCFDCDVHFSQDKNCLWFERKKLSQAKLLGEPQLASLNEHAVIQYLEKMNALSWPERIQQFLHNQLLQPNEEELQQPNLTDTAKAFNISERTLRRYLADEKQSFRMLLQRCKMELADQYLQQNKLSMTEIAYRLGFSDSSNFSRAFQRWYGHLPSRHMTNNQS